MKLNNAPVINKILIISFSSLLVVIGGLYYFNKVNNPIHVVTPLQVKKTTYECGSFRYFNWEDGPPSISKEDIAKLKAYALKHKMKDTSMMALLHFYPRIKGEMDTTWYDKLFFSLSYKNKINSLDYYELTRAVYADAVVIGQVIDIKMEYDITKCFRYKKTYVIRVSEIINDYSGQLKINDTVIGKNMEGIEGGCRPTNPDIAGMGIGDARYSMNETGVFHLEHYGGYYTSFLKMPLWAEQGIIYNDEYCKSFYEIPLFSYIDINDYQKVNDLRTFFKNRKDE